ncbi:diguanylate cyclase [Congzhengia sp.]|uniref:histidine kinase N-terminal 7TM domain-containing diguanylate cyclase n=1 Tax=Congzhengia sp. TaxID=2944168 RepID=UPI0030775F5A
MSAVYGTITIIAFILIGICLLVDKNKERYLLLLFISIFLANLGYFLISIAPSLNFALNANRLSYLGQVFLPYFLLMMLLTICKIDRPKWLNPILITISIVVLFIAASPGILPIYYKTVEIDQSEGFTKIVREYGILHKTYLVYLISYMIAQLSVVIYAICKKRIISYLHAVFLLSATLCNTVIWLVEKFISRNFELLSVSYIITELFILLVYGIVQQYEALKLEKEHLAMFDSMTGLLNSGTVQNKINDILASDKGLGSAMLVIDVDNLKTINDSFGHQAGTTAICLVSNSLKKMFQATDILGRYGGDEFVVFLKGFDGGREQLEKKLHSVLREISSQKIIEQNDLKVSCTIGAAFATAETKGFETLFMRADKALYQAKQSGKNTYLFYE